MKKRKVLVSLVLAFVLLCTAMLPVLAATTGEVVTQSSPLRVRSGPGTGYSVVKQDGAEVKLPKGSPVSILEEVPCGDGSTDYTWYRVEATFNGKIVSGYVASIYIAVTSTDPGDSDDTGDSTAVDIYDVPEPYRPYLIDLMEAHPNWTFTFYDTGLDWNDVQYNESYAGKSFRNVISPSSNSAYRYKDANGNYLKSAEGWYQASDQTIAYYMDPRNLMTESRIFQFELLSYDEDLQTLEGIEAVLKGTFMDGKTITATDGRQVTYAQAILEAAEQSGSSAYFLATKIIQEVGRNGSGSTSGNYTCKDGTVIKGYYNFYNIQATSATNDPIKQGLQYAAGSGSYGRPWNTPYKSIVGGAEWITSGYVLRGQDSIYLQKFDVDSSDGSIYSHQYMTNVAGACSEASITYNAYRDNNLLSQNFVFAIPLYDNLPEERCRLVGDTSVDPDPIPDPQPEPEPEPEPEPTPEPEPEPEPGPEPEPSGVMGDLDGNGIVNATDARRALQIAAGLRDISDALFPQADVNGDDRVDATDARWILQAAAELRELS